jgi:hypothetical protein
VRKVLVVKGDRRRKSIRTIEEFVETAVARRIGKMRGVETLFRLMINAICAILLILRSDFGRHRKSGQ